MGFACIEGNPSKQVENDDHQVKQGEQNIEHMVHGDPRYPITRKCRKRLKNFNVPEMEN